MSSLLDLKSFHFGHKLNNAGVAAWQMNFPQKYCSALVMHEASTKEEEATSGI